MKRLIGRINPGQREAAAFTQLPWVRDYLLERFGIEPFPGTLNLTVQSAEHLDAWEAWRADAGHRLEAPDASFCDARCYPVQVADRVPGVVVYPEVEAYPADKVEIIAAVPLKETLGVSDEDELHVERWSAPELEAVIFDVDGTLVDTIDAFQIVAQRAADPHGLTITREDVCRALNDNIDFWDMIVPADAEDIAALKKQLHTTAFRLWPDILLDHARLVPELKATLEALRTAGLRLGIVTGARTGSFPPLEAAGLMDYFDAVITGEHVSRRKPDPEGILNCLAELEVRAEAAAYLGDTPIDMEASRAAGVLALGVLSGAGDSRVLSLAGATRILTSHTQLAELLEGDPP